MKISTNWLKDFVSLAPPLERISERLTMAGLEVKKMESFQAGHEKDTVFEVEVTSNRPDWLSHLGVAREIAAVENLSLKTVESEKNANRPSAPGWKIELKENEGCPYYTGVYFEGITPCATPDFMKARLEACGVRPVNFLVDVTNYVLFETGQPLHAFDADLIEGKEIRIRRARAGEELLAINGRELKLGVDDLVIADSRQAMALAGIMGGKNTEITTRTRNIFLESAWFHPRWVRRSSRKSGLSSDSSFRFERRTDPEGVDFARERAVALIRQYAKPRFISAVLKAGDKPVLNKEALHFNVTEINRRLGSAVKPHEAFSILTRLGFAIKKESEESWKVSVPSFRSDVSIAVDLVEEVARIYGFENIPETLPAKAPVRIQPNPLIDLEEKVRDLCAGAAFFETVTFSLISPAQLESDVAARGIRVNNPRNADLTLMRPTFYSSLLGVIQRNIRQGARGGAFFEIANLYMRGTEKPVQEKKTLGLAMFGKWKQKNWLDPERDATLYDLKGLLHSLVSLAGVPSLSFSPAEVSFLVAPYARSLWMGPLCVGTIGEISPRVLKLWDIETRVYYAELSLSCVATHIKKTVAFTGIAKFPAIERDLALIVSDSVKAGDIQSRILSKGQGLVTRVELFDLFTGGRIPKGSKNLAFRLVYQSSEKTLRAEDIQKLHAEIADQLTREFHGSFQ